MRQLISTAIRMWVRHKWMSIVGRLRGKSEDLDDTQLDQTAGHRDSDVPPVRVMVLNLVAFVFGGAMLYRYVFTSFQPLTETIVVCHFHEESVAMHILVHSFLLSNNFSSGGSVFSCPSVVPCSVIYVGIVLHHVTNPSAWRVLIGCLFPTINGPNNFMHTRTCVYFLAT